MRKLRSFLWTMFTLCGIAVMLLNSETAYAKKYYSLKNIGLSGCTTDEIDYGIISIRGNSVRYVKYRISKGEGVAERVGNMETARVTNATKYYVGDSVRVPMVLRRNGIARRATNNFKKKDHAKNWNGRNDRLQKKTIDTTKWIYRVRKGEIKRYIAGRNNELQIRNGKIVKMVTQLDY